MGHCNLKLLTKNTIFSGFHSRRSYVYDKLCIDPDLCEEYINRGLNEELLPVLLPVLRHKSFAQNLCQSHTLNCYCAKRVSNLDAKVGLPTLSDPGQHKKMCLFNFQNFDFTAPLKNKAIRQKKLTPTEI